MIFNTFVCMQIFNFLNSRKLSEEYNILGGITRNPIFIGIVLLIAAFQGLIVTFTSNFFQLYSTWGLNGLQWLICIGFGVGGLVVSALLKFLPLAKVQEAAPKV
jgi:P-type Ca2+ transporter type 2B